MRLSFYQVDSEYCEFLRQYDHCVPITSRDKASRPFIGIVLSINEFNYFAPLTSPKKKHVSMKNKQDFMKINNGLWGAINFNNMIPVPTDSLHKINMRLSEEDTPEQKRYKNLMVNQLTWCNANRKNIENRALKLYEKVMKAKLPPEISLRCCDFRMDEKYCKQYSDHHES